MAKILQAQMLFLIFRQHNDCHNLKKKVAVAIDSVKYVIALHLKCAPGNLRSKGYLALTLNSTHSSI